MLVSCCAHWPLYTQVLRAKNKALFEEIRTLKQEKLAVKQELAQMQEQAVRRGNDWVALRRDPSHYEDLV